MSHHWFLKDGKYFPKMGKKRRSVYKPIQGFDRESPSNKELCEWYEKFNNDKDDRYGYSNNDSLNSKGIAFENIDVENSEDKSELPNGIYQYLETCTGAALLPITLPDNDSIHIGNVETTFKKDLEYFLNNKKVWTQFDRRYKRGYLFYGPPGNGKTTLIRSTVDFATAKRKDVVVIFLPDIPATDIVKALTEDPRLKLMVMEEISNLSCNRHDLSKLLIFLDGEKSISNSVTIATTNYSGLLPSNLLKRPGRFDLLLRFDDPDSTTREHLLQFLGEKPESDTIRATEDLSIVTICEMVRQSRILGTSIIEEIEKFRERVAKAEKDFGQENSSIEGFYSVRDVCKSDECDEPVGF